jgi:hypothetical protein
MSHSKLSRLVCATTIVATLGASVLPVREATAGPPWNPNENRNPDSFVVRPRDGHFIVVLPEVRRAPHYRPIVVDEGLEHKRATFVVKLLQLLARAEAALAMYELSRIDPQSEDGRSTVRHQWEHFMDAGDVADLVEQIDLLGWESYSRDVGDLAAASCEHYAYLEVCYDEPWLQIGPNHKKTYTNDVNGRIVQMVAFIEAVVKKWETNDQWHVAPNKDTTVLAEKGNFELQVWHEMIDPVFPPIWSSKKRGSWKKTGALIAGTIGVVGSIAALPFTGGLSAIGIGMIGVVGGAGATVTGAGGGVMHNIKPHHAGQPMNLFWGLTDHAVSQIAIVNTTGKRESQYVAMFLPLLLWERAFPKDFELDALNAKRRAYFDKLLTVMESMSLDSKGLTADHLTEILVNTNAERKALVKELMDARYVELEHFFSD